MPMGQTDRRTKGRTPGRYITLAAKHSKRDKRKMQFNCGNHCPGKMSRGDLSGSECLKALVGAEPRFPQ